jgi:hypothetical protein
MHRHREEVQADIIQRMNPHVGIRAVRQPGETAGWTAPLRSRTHPYLSLFRCHTIL